MRTLMLASLGWLVIGAVVISETNQQPPAPRFEVASVKPNKIGPGSFVPVVQSGGRFTMTNRTLRSLIQFAHSTVQEPLQDSQITSGPHLDWIDTERFDIVAKIEGNPPLSQETSNSARLMLRALLAERFSVRTHTETREVPVYFLVMARNDRRLGEHLRRTATDCRRGPPPTGPLDPQGPLPPCGFLFKGPGLLRFRGVSMTALGTFGFSASVGRIVLDRTRLTGDYDVDLKWTPAPGEPGVPPPPGGPGQNVPDGTDQNGPSLFTAVQEQLGLKLEAQRAPVDVLVIDKADRPTPD